MIWFAAMCVAGAALVAIYMTPPSVERQRISAAEFLDEVPQLQSAERRFRPAAPVRSWSFLVRLLALAGLAAALWFHMQHGVVQEGRSLGVAIVMDVSDSMRVRAGSGDYMDLAKSFVRDVLAHLEGLEDIAVCTRLATFGTVRRDVLKNAEIHVLADALERVSVQPEGTDLTIPRRMLESYARSEPAESGVEPECRPDYVVVVTDQPAPAVGESDDVGLIWRDVSSPHPNAAISKVSQNLDPLTGTTESVDLIVSRWGVLDPTVVVQDFLGRHEYAPDWSADNEWLLRVPTDVEGGLEITLENGGAYDGDDHVRVDVFRNEALSVDWRLEPDAELFRALNLESSMASPALVVARSGSEVDGSDTPTIYLGQGFRDGESEIGGFVEGHPILEGVNFDVLERITSPAQNAYLTAPWVGVIGGVGGDAWVAESGSRVWLPARPDLSDSETARVSLTLFLNSVRWLVGHKKASPHRYSRSDGTPLTDVEEEGTVLSARSIGEFGEMRPSRRPHPGEKVWPHFVMLALALLAADRVLTGVIPGRYE